MNLFIRTLALLLATALPAMVVHAATKPPSPAKTTAAVKVEAAPAAVPAQPAADKTPATPVPAPAAAPATPALPPAAINAPTTVLVQVDDKTITQADVDAETAEIGNMMKNRGITPEQFTALLPKFKAQILDGLVTRALLNAECAKKNITVTDADVKKEIEKFKANLPKKVTMDMVMKQSGMSQAMFETDIKEQLKLEKLLGIAEPTDEEIAKYYQDYKTRFFEVPETVHARHILIKTEATDDAAKKATKKEKAEALRKQLAEGTDFAKLAKENSDCPSKESGGDLGEFRHNQMVPAFEKTAFNLKTNEISEVVETEFGYHIIQTMEHNAPKTMDMAEVKGRIAAMLKSKKMQKEADSLMKSLREKAKITYLNGATPPPAMDMMMPPGVEAPAPAAAPASEGKDTGQK